jgi:hypothetical protein
MRGGAFDLGDERCGEGEVKARDIEITPVCVDVRRDWFNPYARNLVSISDCIHSW